MARRSVKARKKVPMNMAALMDLMTVLLLFLLQSFSADGSMLTNADDVQLPNSVSNERPIDIPLQIVVSQDVIVLDNSVVEDTRALAAREFYEFMADTNTALDIALRDKMEQQLELVRVGALTEARDDIIVQVDKNMSLSVMYKVMVISGRQGFSRMRFAVMMRE